MSPDRCFPEWDCSTTASTSPAGATPSSASPTSGGGASSESAGPESRCTPTSESFEGTLFSDPPCSPAASPARAPRPRASAPASTIPRLRFGPSSHGSLASYDPATCSWRTCETSLLSMTEPFGEPFSGTWPRSASMHGGTVYPLVPSVPLTAATESSALLTTPTGRDWKTGRGWPDSLPDKLLDLLPTPRTSDMNGPGVHGTGGQDLRTVLHLLPTPRATVDKEHGPNGQHWAELRPTIESLSLGASTPPPSNAGKQSTGLRLNPSFVEWMLGAPQGWSDPDSLLSATAYKCKQGIYSDE